MHAGNDEHQPDDGPEYCEGERHVRKGKFRDGRPMPAGDGNAQRHGVQSGALEATCCSKRS
ncbi:MAG: hypothetical protein NVSMB19_18090 [Vulcanimicrobiaceae bacterium]